MGGEEFIFTYSGGEDLFYFCRLIPSKQHFLIQLVEANFVIKSVVLKMLI